MRTFGQFIDLLLSLTEAPTISSKAEYFGYILPNGSDKVGEHGESHVKLAKKLGLSGWEEALKREYIRFAIGYDGSSTFNLVWTSRTKKNLIAYLHTTKELTGDVGIDFEQGKDQQYIEYKDPRTAATAIRNLPDNVKDFPKKKYWFW